jgi:hypothetical protein
VNRETKKWTKAEVEALEVAPPNEHQRLEGWSPELKNPDDLRRALEAAVDYRGDVTLTLHDGSSLAAYVFDLHPGADPAHSTLGYFSPDFPGRRTLAWDRIRGIVFSGRDCAAGRQWEDWRRRKAEALAQGTVAAPPAPEVLD